MHCLTFELSDIETADLRSISDYMIDYVPKFGEQWHDPGLWRRLLHEAAYSEVSALWDRAKAENEKNRAALIEAPKLQEEDKESFLDFIRGL